MPQHYLNDPNSGSYSQLVSRRLRIQTAAFRPETGWYAKPSVMITALTFACAEKSSSFLSDFQLFKNPPTETDE